MLGERLRELRTAHNMSTVQLAQLLDVSKQSISNWENENILPSIEMLVKIADLFSVQTDYLLGRSNKSYLNAEGLTNDQLAHVHQLIAYLRKLNIASANSIHTIKKD